VPTQMNPVSVGQFVENCNQTRISWMPLGSCDELTKNEVQCIGADGIYSDMKTQASSGDSTELIMDTSDF
jgi:hypothetical protein